ncbi:MAG: inducible mutagenesis protein A [Sneathiella sp.]
METLRRQDMATLKAQINALDAPACLNDFQAENPVCPIPPLDTALPDGGLARGALHEFVPGEYADFPAAVGFAGCLLHLLAGANLPMLWCSLGRGLDYPPLLFPPGLSNLGIDPDRILHVEVRSEKEMLWVLEEGLSSPACPLLIAAMSEPEKLYDFKASRRLSLRAARHGGTLLLIRHHHANHPSKRRGSTAAATRWSISSRPSRPVFFSNARMPGFSSPRWHVALTRCKRGKPQHWQLEWDHEAFSFRLATPLGDRTTPAAPDPLAEASIGTESFPLQSVGG